jgi:hypothetical protein
VEADCVKTPVVASDDYTLYLEDYNGFEFIHCDCRRWTNEVRKRMLDDLVKLQKDDLYAIHEIEDAKHEKFLKLFGFKFLEDFVGADGKARQTYVRRA